MGSQIGYEYLLSGHDVVWIVRDTERAAAAIDRARSVAIEGGLVSSEQTREHGARQTIVTSVADVAEVPEIVVESVAEDLDTKAELLSSCARVWPEAILASNTSSIEIGRIGSAVGAPERTVGTHYWNPPLLMPLVEVISGPQTSPAVVRHVVDLLENVGKRPVQVDHDVPGFVWNRLQFALLREALWLVDSGVASPEAVDLVVRDGLARRWQLTGPFETAELGGVQTFAAIAALLFPALSSDRDAPSLATWEPRDAAALEQLERRRDAALAAALLRERESTRH